MYAELPITFAVKTGAFGNGKCETFIISANRKILM